MTTTSPMENLAFRSGSLRAHLEIVLEDLRWVEQALTTRSHSDIKRRLGTRIATIDRVLNEISAIDQEPRVRKHGSTHPAGLPHD